MHMTPTEFRAALERLDMTPTSFARLVGSNEKNMRRAAEDESDGPGPAASFALRCLLALQAIASAESQADMREIAEEALIGQFERL